MAIVKMKRLSLLAVRDNRDALMRELIARGCVEISEVGAEIAQTQWGSVLKREAGASLTWKNKLSSVGHALDILQKYAPEKSKLLSAKEELSDEEFLREDRLEEALAQAHRIEGTEEAVRRTEAELSRLDGVRSMLGPWEKLDLPLGTEETERCAVILATLPAKCELAQVQSAVAAVCEEAELFDVNSDKEFRYVLLIAWREELSKVQDALRPFGFSAVSFSGVTENAADYARSCEQQMQELEALKQEQTAAVRAYSTERELLKKAYDGMLAQLSLSEANEKLFGTQSTVVLQGWMPAEREEELREVFERYDCAWETEDPSEEEYPEVPVQLKNNKVTNALNMVTEMYSLPQYGTVDPNPLMAPFFILFYGLMMADIGYGIMMILAAVVALRKMKPREGTLSFCQLLLYCGISTFVMGFVTGGLFSDAPLQIAQMINPETSFRGLPYLLNPTASDVFRIFGMELDSASLVLYGSMVLGLLHMNTGMVVNFVSKWKKGDKMSAVFEEGSLWLLLVGLILFVLGIGNVAGVPALLILAVAALIYGAGRTATGFGKVTAAFSCIYNTLTGWFGDILSYARIMALMLAGGVIGQVFNTVAAMPAKSNGLNFVTGLVFLVIFLLGHFMNFALNLLGCYVHDLRLQCLEYFNKFYVSGGRAFAPLRIAGKYFNTKVKE